MVSMTASWRDSRKIPSRRVGESQLARYGLRLLDYTDIDTELPMAFDGNLRCMLSEVNVDDAITSPR
jgi:hypothetical protein